MAKIASAKDLQQEKKQVLKPEAIPKSKVKKDDIVTLVVMYKNRVEKEFRIPFNIASSIASEYQRYCDSRGKKNSLRGDPRGIIIKDADTALIVTSIDPTTVTTMYIKEALEPENGT